MNPPAKQGFWSRVLPDAFRYTMMVRGWSFFKIPLLFYVSPRVVRLDEEATVIKIPLNRRTRNHVKVMYIAALVTGADISCALLAMQLVRISGAKVVPIFKHVNAQFLRRVEGDVYFTCTQGDQIKALVEEALSTGKRATRSLEVIATVPSINPDEVVARFDMGLSIKPKN